MNMEEQATGERGKRKEMNLSSQRHGCDRCLRVGGSEEKSAKKKRNLHRVL
jgi:hypothetical protein